MSYPYNNYSIFLENNLPSQNTGLNLQESYNISNQPQIVTNQKGALIVEEGTSDSVTAFSVRDLGGSDTFYVHGDGSTSVSNLTTLSSSGQSLTVTSNQPSTSQSDGACVIYGGIGVGLNLYASTGVFSGNLTVAGSNNVSLKNTVTN